MSDTTTYKIVTLRLACDPRYDAPEHWDWQTLIDATDPVTVLSVTDASGIESNQSKHVGEDGKLRYNADGSEVFPGATGVRPDHSATGRSLMIFHRIYLGDITPPALERIMETVRAECRSDELRWFSLEQAQVSMDDHPRNPGQKWTEIEGDE